MYKMKTFHDSALQIHSRGTHAIGPDRHEVRRFVALFSLVALSGLRTFADAYTGTAFPVAVPVPGVLCTNESGQVSLKGNVHVLRVQATDPRQTGRLQAAMDLTYQADGTAIFAGKAAQEVGTWDLADPMNPRFIPTGGVWDIQYRGVAQADNSNQTTLMGLGIGGAIEGLRMEEIVRRGPGVVFDPAIAYVGAGVMLTPPKDAIVVMDNFNNPPAPSWPTGAGDGTMALLETGGELLIRGHWPLIHTRTGPDTSAFTSPLRPWTVRAGQTLETRVDLVKLSGPEAGAVLALYHDNSEGYLMVKGSNYVILAKQIGGLCFLSAERVMTPNTNVVMTLAVTPAGAHLLVTARILDRGPGGSVLYEHSVLDTSAADGSLTASQVQAATGMALQNLRSDSAGSSWTSGTSATLMVYQYTDGTLPAVEGTFDNFEFRTYEVPQVAVERTVRLTWPESAVADYGLESASTVGGPWLPVITPALPGFKQVTVPASRELQIFRLRELP
jgi:hypothetical protein